jgi:dolichyl-phosphate beta-glucosyltransferase
MLHIESTRRGEEQATFSLIFPVYNPGPVLERTWDEVTAFLSSQTESWEALFVCDGCTDGTPQHLKRLTRGTRQNIHVLSYEPNHGKGYAVCRGLAQATGQWRIFTDVDLAYGFDDILQVARTLQQGAEVVIGARTHPDSQIVLPTRLLSYARRRHFQGRIFSWAARRLLPITQLDPQAGLKGFQADAIRRLLPHLRCWGFGFDCDLLTGCAHLGLKITEIPVRVRLETTASTTGLRQSIRMLYDLWKIRRAWRQAPLPQPAPASVTETEELSVAA